jgi:hypothetical protein
MIDLHQLDHYRVTDPDALMPHAMGWSGDGEHGSFVIPSCVDRGRMVVIASNDEGWDHCSVSRRNRVPNWAEMSQIHRLFFKADEVCIQLHLPEDLHINVHPFVLHIWRSHEQTLLLPPRIFV